MTTELVTTYFGEEGRASMKECIHRSAEWAVEHALETLVIFTGTGEGPYYAAKELLVRERFATLRVVAVTPPSGRPYRQNPGDPDSPLIRSGINPTMRDELEQLGVSVVSAHLPFKEMYDGKERTSEWTRVLEAFGVLGGGFALCVQASLVACDAGFVDHGQRVIALSADTAFVVRASRTESFLAPLDGLLIEHIICRPARYTISKRLHEAFASPPVTSEVLDTIGVESEPAQLPSSTVDEKA